MSFPFRSLLLLPAASAGLAQAPHAEHPPVALEHVVVSAHPYARSQLELAQPTNVLQGRSLDARQALTLGELLSSEPGISSTWFGPGAARPIIRGLGGDRLRVLQNGLGTIDASVTSPDHAVALDPLLIERVEVVRGPASLLYGSSAVGGIVNVVTHRIHQVRPEQAFEGRVEARAGSVNDERSGGIVLEGGAGQVAWHLDGFRRETEDVTIPGYAYSARLREALEEEHEEEHPDDEHEPLAHGRIPNTGIISDGGAGGLSFIGSRGHVGFAFSGMNSFYGVPPGGHEHEHEHEEEHAEEGDEEENAEHAVSIDLRQRRVDLEGSWTAESPWLESVRFKVSRVEYRHQELEDDEVGTVFRNRGHEARLELLHQPLGRFTGAAGLQWNRQRLSAIGEEAFLPPSRTDQQALFLVEEARFDPITWQFGARWERQDVAVRDGSGRSRDDGAVSLSSGLVWTLNDQWSLASAVTRTERPPNAQELYSFGPHIGTLAFEVGDPDLAKERSLGVDLSLRRRTGNATGSLTVFLNEFDGFIFPQATGEVEDGLDVFTYVQRSARFAGAELESVFHLHEATVTGLDLTLGADLVRARNTSDDTNLPRITPPRLRAGVDGRWGDWTAGLEAQHVWAQDHIAPAETATDSYTLYSAYVGWRRALGTRSLDAFLRGTNLTDEEARMHTSFLKEIAPLPGRNISAAVRLSF